ncbi:MAG: GFA family protein [Pseudomonadota bacterium]
MTQTGQCLCGAVRYTLDGEPMVTAICHCTNCQRQSGAAFSVNLMAAEGQLSIEGDMLVFEDQADSGNVVYRKFCGRCGSPILSALSGMPGVVALKAGTLDDPSTVAPSVQVFCDSKQNWIEFPALIAFEKSPPSA